MIIDCISDLHGYRPSLLGGDLLIIAGDLTTSDKGYQYLEFVEWVKTLPYKKIVIVAGNHDCLIEKGRWKINDYFDDSPHIQYLEDSGTDFKGMQIWGSPWTLTFPEMNSHCKAFTYQLEREIAKKWELIPSDVDILITHSPPKGVLDSTIDGLLVGSKTLLNNLGRIKPRLWVFGHIHESYGERKDISLTGREYHFVNASHVNENYQPVNDPIRVVLPQKG